MKIVHLLRRFYWECKGKSAFGELTLPFTSLGCASGIIYGTLMFDKKNKNNKPNFIFDTQLESAIAHGCLGAGVGLFWFATVPSYCVYTLASSFKKYSQLVND